MHITKESKLRVVMLIGIFAVLIMLFGISLTTGRSASAVHDEFKEETTISDEIKIDSSESELVGAAGVIYASGSSGVDTNDGASSSTPVASMTRILELLPDGGTVNVLSPIVIEEDIDINPSAQITFFRTTEGLSATYKDGTASYGEMIKIMGTDTTVNFYKTTFDGNNIEPVAGNIRYLMLLSSSGSTTVTFNDGCIIQNNHTRGVVATQGDINISTTDLTIQNCEGEFLGFIVNRSFFMIESYNMIISGLRAINNVGRDVNDRRYHAGLFIDVYGITGMTGNLDIKNSVFDANTMDSNIEGDKKASIIMFHGNDGQSCLIENCKFLKFKTNNNEVFCYGFNHTIEVKNCLIEGLTTVSGYGWLIRDSKTATFDNIEIRNCVVATATIFNIYNIQQEVYVTNSSFSNNEGAGTLLGILDNQASFTSIENCDFEHNSVLNQIGFHDNGSKNVEAIIKNCSIKNISTSGTAMRGIRVESDLNSLTISDCDFINCNTSAGIVSTPFGISEFTMTNCKFENNITTGDGACLNATSSGNWEFNDCVFLNNHATGSGGAIYLNDIDIEGTPRFNVVFNGCEFGYNTAYGGGGAVSIGNPGENWSEDNAAVDTTYGNSTFSNCYFHNNEVFADDDGYSLGFALFTDTYYENVVEDCTFEYNVGGDKLIEARSLTINDTNLLYNTATDSDGWILSSYSLETSGLRVVGNSTEYALIGSSDFSMNNSYFNDNYSKSGLIYGFWMNELADCVIENNTTDYLVGFSDNASITNIEIKDNLVDLYAICQTGGYLDEAEITFDNLKITNNTIMSSGNSGSGLFFAKPATGVISNSVFSGNTFNTSHTNSALAVLRTTLAGEQGLTFENCDFVGNVSGGGLFRLWGNFSSTAQTTSYYLNLSNCVLSGNVTETGMIDILATSDYQGIVNITDSVIYGNTDLNGAVIRSSEYVNLNISNTNIFSNMGAKGGAISVGNNGKLILGGGVEFGNNIAEFGSSIYVEDGGEASISNVVLHDMTGVSGVFYTEHGGELNIIGGEIYNNTGENGSAFYYDGSGVISGVVAYNNSGTNGGVLYVGSTGSVVLDDIDFYSNSATNGGAVYVEGTVNFRSGEIRENTATNGGGVYVGESGSFAMSYTERLEITGSSASRVAVYGVVDSNTADYGGGVYIAENGSATINGGHKNGQDEDESSTIEGAGVNNNTTNYNGGGVYVSANATLTILGGEVDGNVNSTYEHKILGVGIYNAGTLIINGGVLRGNWARLDTIAGTHNVFGGGVYSDSGSTISVTNAYIYRSHAHDGGAMYLKDTQATVKNSYFDSNLNNATTGRWGAGAVFLVEGGNLTVDNCLFMNNRGGTVYSNGLIAGSSLATLNVSNSIFESNASSTYFDIYGYGETEVKYWDEINLINCDIDFSNSSSIPEMRDQVYVYFGANKINIINCDFHNTESGLDRANGGIIVNTRGSTLVEGCTFTGQDAGLRLSGQAGANIMIKGCTFSEIDSSNANDGHLTAPISTSYPLIVEISNCEFRNNNTNTSASAIEIGYNTQRTAQVYLSGEIIIENNTTTSGHGALYINDPNVIIRDGTRLVVENNVGGNIVFGSNADKGVLEGDLDGESKVYIDIPSNASAGDLIVGGISSNYLMTNSILDNFYLSDSNYGLRFSEEQNALVLYDKSENGELSAVVSDKVVVQEVGESYGLEDGDIEVLFSGASYQGEYSIEYSLSGEEGTWETESPVFRAKGEHTIFYRVNADILDEPIQGSVTIKVIGQRIYVKNLPSAKLRYGETLSRAVFGGGLVEDEKGQAVAGVWSFSEGSVVPRDTTAYYEATFTPYNEVYENSNVISVSVPVTISYGVVFYANGGFVTDEGDVNNSYTGINNLSQMIEYMSDNGSIIFTETYTVIGDISIVSNKNIDFVRYSTFKTGPMIIVDVDSSLILNGGAGSIVFEGGGALSGTSGFNGVVLDNYGEVNLQTNVVFRGFVVHYETVGGDIYSPIRNREGATLRLNGAQIYGNILRSGLSTTGGIIYNEGKLYISGGRYFSNHMDGMDEKGEPSTSIREGIGGFIYNLGSVSMSGGEIFNNRAEYGGAIYVAGGVVTLNGGSIYANQTSLGGGALYVASGGEIILGATNIYGNFATSGENGIENAGGDIFDIDLSKVSSEMLAEIESNNYDMGLKFDEDVEGWGAPSNGQDAVILGLLFTAFVLAFLCIVVVRKNKKKF